MTRTTMLAFALFFVFAAAMVAFILLGDSVSVIVYGLGAIGCVGVIEQDYRSRNAD